MLAVKMCNYYNNFTIQLSLCLAGWQGDAVFKATFSKGGAIEFAEAFQRAVRNGKNNASTLYVSEPFSG